LLFHFNGARYFSPKNLFKKTTFGCRGLRWQTIHFLPITYKAFFEKENNHSHHPPDKNFQGLDSGHHEDVKEIPMVAIPLFITGIISIIMGMYPDYFVQLAKVALGIPH